MAGSTSVKFQNIPTSQAKAGKQDWQKIFEIGEKLLQKRILTEFVIPALSVSGHPLLPALLVLSPRPFHLLELFDLPGAKEDSVSVFGFPTVGVFAARECFVDPTFSGKILSVPALQTASPPVLNAVGVGEIFGVWSVPRVWSHRSHHTGAALTCVEVIEAAGSPKKRQK